MRVFELMAALADMPSNATVVFERLAAKEELEKWPSDPSLTHLEFTIRTVEERDANYAGATPRVILDGWAE